MNATAFPASLTGRIWFFCRTTDHYCIYELPRPSDSSSSHPPRSFVAESSGDSGGVRAPGDPSRSSNRRLRNAPGSWPPVEVPDRQPDLPVCSPHSPCEARPAARCRPEGLRSPYPTGPYRMAHAKSHDRRRYAHAAGASRCGSSRLHRARAGHSRASGDGSTQVSPVEGNSR